MKIYHANIFGSDGKFHLGEITIDGGRITSVVTEDGKLCYLPQEHSHEEHLEKRQEEIDAHQAYLLPGLIDMHFHGCMGADVCDATPDAVRTLMAYEASVGVTAIAPATMTLSVEALEGVLENAAECRDFLEPGLADLVGLNMEGPFISPVKKGAQDERHILPCSADLGERFLEASQGLVKVIGLAPEESPNAQEYIRRMKDQVRISLAHTNADYDCARAAFDAGASHVVHLYNAMPPMGHRAPGVIGAAAEKPDVTAELICDGIHVHPSAVRAAYRLFGPERIVLISDSIRATGMPDGRYTLGGLEVIVKGKEARLKKGGALAGSVTNLADCLRTAVLDMGIPLEWAAAGATINPARVLGIEQEYGSIEPGRRADLVLLGSHLELIRVMKNGQWLPGSVSQCARKLAREGRTNETDRGNSCLCSAE